MDETFKPESLAVKDLFGNNNSLFQIPSYQRPYSWGDEQVEKLWEDLYDAYQNNRADSKVDSQYFLGSIISVPAENGYQDVVDGQQRLTTLIILFCAVRDLFPNLNSKSSMNDPKIIRGKRLQRFIYDDEERQRLKLNTHPQHQNDLEHNVMQKIDLAMEKPRDSQIKRYPEQRFLNTAYIFLQKLREIGDEDAGLFINYLFNQVYIIKITCASQASAIKLFQVLNARGMDLQPSDLIKSYLMSKLQAGKEKQFVADWQKLEEIVHDTDLEMDEFFTLFEYYSIASNPRFSLNEEIENILKDTDSNKAISDLKNLAKLYSEKIWDTNDKAISALWYLRWQMYWKTIILSAHQENFEEKERLAHTMRRFYYLYWIAGKTLTQIKQASFNVIKWVKEGKSISFIESELNKKIDDDDVIDLALRNLKGEVYQQAWIKPVLIMIEYNQTDKSGSFIYWDNKLHAEHVLPVEYRSFKEWSHISDEVARKFLHSIGNLTLLSGAKNIEASNNPFESKVSVYKGKGKYSDKKEGITGFRITQKIVDEFDAGKTGKWDEVAMINRWNWFCEELGEILEIDCSSIMLPARSSKSA